MTHRSEAEAGGLRADRLAAPVFALLLMFALLAREGPRPPRHEPRLAAVERFLEGEGAWNLRRVQLALAAGRVPQRDRAARFQGEGAVVDPPLFAAVLAGLGRFAVGDSTGAAGAAPLDEERLANWLRHVGPLLGVLFVLVAYRLAARLSTAGARALPLLAAAQLAVGAPFVLAAGQGRLPLGVWTAILGGLGLSTALPLLRESGDSVDRLQAALLAGLVLGAAVASSAIGLAVVLPLSAALWPGLLRASGSEQRRERAREMLLLAVPAACLAALPALGGPWQPPPADGPVAAWARAAPLFVLVGALPALLSFWPPVARRVGGRAATRVAVAVACAAGVVLVLAVAPAPPAPRLPDASPAWGVLHLVGLTLCLRGEGTIAVRLAGAVLVGALGAACFDPRALQLVGLAGAAVTAVACFPSGRPTRRWLLLAVGVVLVVDLVGAFHGRGATAGRGAECSAVVRALRALRETTPSAGPWNASGVVPTWCVAAPPELAPAVLLHARRPVLCTAGRVAGPCERGDDLWAAPDAESLGVEARRLGVALVCLRPGDLPALEARIGREPRFLESLLREGDAPERVRAGPEDASGRAALTLVRTSPESFGGKR